MSRDGPGYQSLGDARSVGVAHGLERGDDALFHSADHGAGNSPLTSALPTSVTRSRKRLLISHEVSGSRRQAWHAAPLICPPGSGALSMQSGSCEHHDACSCIEATTDAKRDFSPIATSPPRLPSESAEAVYTRMPRAPSSA